MKIYTKTGDQGQTALFQGPRVAKNHPCIEAYGTVDELNSIIGMIIPNVAQAEIKEKLYRLQNTLFALGSDLATPLEKNSSARFSEQHIQTLEDDMDMWEQTLSPLKNFILPGGSIAASYAHLARTVCRRAERACIRLLEEKKIHIPSYQFLNRLSDWLFVLARVLNQVEGIKDIEWKS
ncbi:MAG: cob(I)yrinic acid a,c-diamide adenosyltransferase [Bdellovibrionales bacterium]|nr:cob(I)yrinic acid a,c-diamide adenosyltransferase [Bdellovibrionales bacterium]